MQWVTNGWPAWPTTISHYITKQERLISMQMPYWGFPGQDACLTTQALTSRSQLQQYGLAKRLPSKAPQAPYRHTVAICMFWTQCRTVSMSPAWPWKTGVRPSRQIQPWVWSLLDCGIEPWGDDSPNRLTLLNSITCHVSESISDYKKVSYIGEPNPGNPRRPSFSWFCQLCTGRSL